MHITPKTRAERMVPDIFVVPSDEGRSSDQKLKRKKFRLGMRNNFSTLKVAEHWNRLPLEIFKTHLEMFLCNLS